MVGFSRTCRDTNASGAPCNATPQRESQYCFWHDPESAEDAAKARQLGGKARRRESTLQGVYDVGELACVTDIRRILKIATLDTLGLENSVSRNRTLGSLGLALAKLLEVGELEQRVGSLEAAVKHQELPPPVFGVE